MKPTIILFALLSVLTSAQSKTEKDDIINWKFLTFQGSERVYYLPASLKSAGDIFRIKLLCTSDTLSAIPYTIFVEDYNRVNLTNRIIQVSTYDRSWQPIDQINIDNSDDEELWVRVKKGSSSYKILECLLEGEKHKFDE